MSVRTGRIIPVPEYGNKYHDDFVDAKGYKGKYFVLNSGERGIVAKASNLKFQFTDGS